MPPEEEEVPSGVRVFVALAALLYGAAAAASDLPSAKPDSEEPEMLPPPDRELYEIKNWEAWLQIASRTDVFDGPHVSVGLMIDLASVWDEERRVRTGIYFALLGGSWGDGARGHLTPEAGFVHRASFYMDDLFDIHAAWRLGFNVGLLEDPPEADPQFGLRNAIGLGLRGGRFVMVELTYDRQWIFDDVFAKGDGTNATLQVHGLTLSGGIDLCFSSCADEPEEPKPRDLTDELYEQAAELEGRSADLCPAVWRALDADHYHPRAGEDGIEAFLRGVRDLMADPKIKQELDALIKLHEKHCARRNDNAAWSRWAAQQRRQLRRPIHYAPVAVELRRAMGCDPPLTEE